MTGENVSKRLEAHQMTLKEIAEKSGIPYVSMLNMKVSQNYKTSIIDKLSETTGLHVIELVCTDQEIMELMAKKANELKKKFPGFVDKIFGHNT